MASSPCPVSSPISCTVSSGGGIEARFRLCSSWLDWSAEWPWQLACGSAISSAVQRTAILPSSNAVDSFWRALSLGYSWFETLRRCQLSQDRTCSNARSLALAQANPAEELAQDSTRAQDDVKENRSSGLLLVRLLGLEFSVEHALDL